MATSGLYGSSVAGVVAANPGVETTGLYGNATNIGGTYFEWFIFQESATAPATPTGGSWNFQTNTGVPPAGWSVTPPANPTNIVWASITFVDSRSSATLVWTTPASWVRAGTAGTAATIAAGTTTTLAPGSAATVANSGTSSAAVFNFGIPQGTTGATGPTGATGTPGADATIAAGTTTTGAAGTSAAVTNVGTSSAAVFNFAIPRGDVGATGPTGPTGAQGVPGINWLGTWSGATTYAIRDAVGYLGSSYYAIASNTNQAPPNATYWNLLAEKGTNGTGAGTVTSVDVSGGTTGLTTSGGPVTGSGTITLAGTLAVANGGTGVTTSTGTGSTVLSTSPALTSPRINFINDTNGNEVLGLSPTASATDYLTVKNGIGVGVPLHVYADGPSANIGLHIQPKGTGLVTISDGTDFNKGIRFRSSGSAASAVTLLDAVATAGRVVTFPDASTTLVGKDTTDTLTNKTINLANNTLQATSAQIAAAVTDETGTGALVFGTNPTITGGTLNPTTLQENSSPVVVQTDIGTAPNEIPLNQYLGEMAYMNAESVVIQPQATAVPNGIGDMVFQLTSNTSLLIRVKGSDGTVRSVTLTLA